MEYEQLTPAQQREMVRQRVEQAESAHYALILNKLANAGNPNSNTAKDFDEPLRLQERGIEQMRTELRRVDERIAAAAESDPPPPPPRSGAPTSDRPATEPPHPAGADHVVSAALGDVSEPQNDAPAP